MRIGNIILIVIIDICVVSCIGLFFNKIYEHPVEGEYGSLKGTIVNKSVEYRNEEKKYYFTLTKKFGQNEIDKNFKIDVTEKEYNNYKVGDYYE